MRLESFERRSPSINLSALVDVLFILIVFIMLAADFDRADRVGAIEVELPGASNPTAVPQNAARLVVPLRGQLELDGKYIESRDLAGFLSEARGHRIQLLIIADGEIPLFRATAIIEAARAAGFADVSVAARSGSSR